MASEQWFLREMRNNLGLTQQQVAGASAITQPFISQFENGRRNPTDAERKHLATAFIRLAAARELEQLLRSLRPR